MRSDQDRTIGPTCGLRWSLSVRPVDSDGVYRSDLWTPMESIGLQKSETPEIGDSRNRRLQKSESQKTECMDFDSPLAR